MIEKLANGIFVPFPANGYNFQRDLDEILEEVASVLVARYEFVRKISAVTYSVTEPKQDTHGEAADA